MRSSFYYLCIFAPLSLLILVIIAYAVDVPYMDQWDIIPMFELSYQGKLRVIDLRAPHLEHRPFFPRVVTIYLGRLTHWNVKWEMAFGVVLATGLFVLLSIAAASVRRQCAPGSAGRYDRIWSIPAIAVLVFSLRQHSNWLWGWQMAVFMNMFAVVFGLFCLSRPYLTLRIFSGALVLGVVACFSFANGLLYWPLGLFMLLFSRDPHRSRKALCIVCWIAVSLTAFLSYFNRRGGHITGLLPIGDLGSLVGHAIYALTYLGSPLSTIHAGAIGLAGLLLSGCSLAVLIRARRVDSRELVFWGSLVCYAAGSALLTSFGRIGLGVEQALSSRYTTFSNLLWVSNLVFLFALTHEHILDRHRLPRVISRTAALAAITILLLSISASLGSVERIRSTSNKLTAARSELLKGGRSPALRTLYPNASIVRERLRTLRRYGLSVYRGQPSKRSVISTSVSRKHS